MRKVSIILPAVLTFMLLTGPTCCQRQKSHDFKKEAPEISLMGSSENGKDIKNLVPVRKAEVEQPVGKDDKKAPVKKAPLDTTESDFFKRYKFKPLKPEVKKEQLMH